MRGGPTRPSHSGCSVPACGNLCEETAVCKTAGRTNKQAAFVPVYAADRHRTPALTLPSRLQWVPMTCFTI